MNMETWTWSTTGATGPGFYKLSFGVSGGTKNEEYFFYCKSRSEAKRHRDKLLSQNPQFSTCAIYKKAD